MKRVLYFIAAIFLLPLYPLLKKMKPMIADKMRFCEMIVVVIEKNGKKKTLITRR